MDESSIIRLKQADKEKIISDCKLIIGHFEWLVETVIPLNPKFHIYSKKSLEWWIEFLRGYSGWVEDNDFITKKQNVKVGESFELARKLIDRITTNKKLITKK